MEINSSGNVVSISQEDIIDGKLIFPKEVTQIFVDENVFKGFKFNEIAFEEGSNLLDIGAYSFNNISTLEKINLSNCDKLKIIRKSAFANNENLKEIVFSPNAKLESIEHMAFNNLKKLKVIDFSVFRELTEIPTALFEGCESIEKIDLTPIKNLHNIADYAFSHMHNLKEIIFPEKDELNSVGKYAFGDCRSLKCIDFSNRNNLRRIGTNCFWNCTNLQLVNLENSNGIFRLDERVFSQTSVENFNIKNASIKLLGYKQGEPFSCNTVELSVDNTFVHKAKLTNRFKENANVKLYDREKLIYDGAIKDAPFKDINLCALRVYLTQKRRNLNWSDNFINGMDNLEEMKICEKYLNELSELLSAISEDNETKVFNVMQLLRVLGFYNFELCKKEENYKQEMESYKNLLAKDLMKHKIIKEILSENNKDFINQLIQEKTNKLARSMPLEELVLEFAKNNFVEYENLDKLLYQVNNMDFDYPSNKQYALLFAQFFVNNIDEINDKIAKTKLPQPMCADNQNSDMKDGSISLYDIYNNFYSTVNSSNKKIISRSNNQRLSLKDCEFNKEYANVEEGNEVLAKLCGDAHFYQSQFEIIQKIFNEGKGNIEKQVLEICDDDKKTGINYEFIKKDNPIGMVLGNITNSCQAIDRIGVSCMIYGATNPYSGFIVFKNNENIIGQSWVWYDPKTNTIALDNIEVPDVYNKLVNIQKEGEVLDCVERVCKNFYETMTNKGCEIKNIIIGQHCTDIEGLFKRYYLEQDEEKEIESTDPLITYSDIANDGQFIIYKDGKPFEKKMENDNAIVR